ncbi:protein of unknown function [Agrobacterium pusense]|uniref:Uncharacterized protein n=1 Tax=Agrobacterium pusense TaxID=648995 RepID=U4PPT4_9HYPH|nr:protein of unknown function [Agrobacterium pusense]
MVMDTRVANADYMGNIGIAKTIIAPSHNQGPGALENVIGFGFRAFHAFTYQLVGRMSNTFFAVNKPRRWDPDEDRPRRPQAENHEIKACPPPLPRHCLAPIDMPLALASRLALLPAAFASGLLVLRTS